MGPIDRTVRVLLTGEENWRSKPLAERIVKRLLARYGRELLLVYPTGDGIVRDVQEACFPHVEREPHSILVRHPRPADARWQNEVMVKAGARFLIVCHRDLTRASAEVRDLVERVLAAGIPVWLIDSEDAEPRRIWKA